MENDDRSKLLDLHTREGESQTVEFKVAIPENARKLAENIASFATSNQGTIYIGVKNSGEIIGIQEGVDSPEWRDGLQQRIIGIVQLIDPRIKVNMEFIKTGSKNIVRITGILRWKYAVFEGSFHFSRGQTKRSERNMRKIFLDTSRFKI